MTRLEQGQVILLDGGTGTELEQRGADMHAKGWSASANLTHPDLLRDIHKDYIQAGAEIIIANTFSTSKHVLAACGLEAQFEVLNRKAVQLAQEARDAVAASPVLIAASISTTTFGGDQPPVELARDNFARQAELYAEAGVDLIMLEMMRDIDYTRIVLEAAKQTGLPVWLGYSTELDDGGKVWLYGKQVSFADALQALDADSTALISIMHTLTEDIAPSLAVLKDHWSGFTGVYAHSGEFIMPNWQFIDMISPEDYTTEAERWMEQGVQLIGGCCGIGKDHIQMLRERLIKMP